MKRLPSLRSLILVAATALAAFVAPARAGTYTVQIDTSSLLGNPSGPFSIDFQSIFGSGSAQTITVGNFALTGGTLVSGTDWSTGAVSGNLATTLLLNPSSANFYNEFLQQFDATVSSIQFNLHVTTNSSGITPTSFAVAILDSGLLNIPTTGLGDSLLHVDLNGAHTTIDTSSSIGSTAGVTVTVPDASSTLSLVFGAMAAVGLVASRRRAAALACA